MVLYTHLLEPKNLAMLPQCFGEVCLNSPVKLNGKIKFDTRKYVRIGRNFATKTMGLVPGPGKLEQTVENMVWGSGVRGQDFNCKCQNNVPSNQPANGTNLCMNNLFASKLAAPFNHICLFWLHFSEMCSPRRAVETKNKTLKISFVWISSVVRWF